MTIQLDRAVSLGHAVRLGTLNDANSCVHRPEMSISDWLHGPGIGLGHGEPALELGAEVDD